VGRTPSKKPNTTNLLLALVLTAVAAALRFYHLSYHDLRGDEAFSIIFVGNNWASLLAQLGAGEPHPPLYFSTLKVWLAIAGQSEFAARWLSAAAGVVTVPLLFKATARIAGTAAAAIVALLVALSPSLIWNAQDVRMYSLATALCTAVVYWGLRLASGEATPKRSEAAALAVSCLLALYTHYVAAVVVATVYAVLFLRIPRLPAARRAHHLLTIAASGAVAALLYAPWLAFGLASLGPSYQGNFRSPELLDALLATAHYTLAGELPTGIDANYFLVPAALALLAGVLTLARRQAAAVSLLLSVVAVPVLALFVASRFRPVFSERYLLLVVPAMYCLLGVGLAGAFERSSRRGILDRGGQLARLLMAVTLATSVALTLGSYFRDRAGEGPGTWRSHVAWVVDRVSPEDLVLVNHLDPSFNYYYRLLGGSAPTMVSPPKQNASAHDVESQLRPVLTPGKRVLLAQDTARIWDPGKAARKWLEYNSVPVAVHDVDGKDVGEFRVPAGVQVGVEFGQLLRLERAEVRGHGEPLAPGAILTADLVWNALAKTNADYSVSLQIVDAAGRLVAQNDGPPRQGQARTYELTEGQTVIDTRSLPLPPVAGRYRLGAAVYDYASGIRLPIARSADNMAWLAELVVAP
jgi:uncharacterized membrane protein